MSTNRRDDGAGKPPRISVILPVHRHEAYVGLAVQSILDQTFRDFELIAIDDGISASSSAILDEFARNDNRIRVLRLPNAGFSEKLNHGLAAARGEFAARMDADDISQPDRFARQVAYLDMHPNVAVVGSAVTLIDEQGHILRDSDYPQQPPEVEAFLQRDSALAHPTVLMRRAAVLAVGGYRPIYQPADDYDLWLRMAERYALANLPQRLLLYRQHANKLSFEHAFEQVLAARIALLAAKRRRAGEDDPTDQLQSLSLADLDRFALTDRERFRILLDLIDVLLAADARTPATDQIDKATALAEQLRFDHHLHWRAADTLLRLAISHARRGRNEKALQLCRRALASHWLGPVDVGAVLLRHAGSYLAARCRRLRPT